MELGPAPQPVFHATQLTVENKQKMLDIITTLRNYQLIGIVEARNWIEFLFPEFGEFRDHEADQIFQEMATVARDGKPTPPNPGNTR